MNGFQLADGLDLDHDQTFDDKVGAAGADMLAFIEDIHFLLADDIEVGLAHFDVEGTLVDDFLVAVSEGIMDAEGAADDALGDVFV